MPPSPTALDAIVFQRGTLFDGERTWPEPVDVAVALGNVLGIGTGLSLSGTGGVSTIEGGFLFPGFVDAHVHLSMSDPASVAAGSVTGVLDLGSPLPYAFAPHPPLGFAAAGPLITARRGYPTTSWGANGYGLEVDGPDQARDGVGLLAASGAAIVKIAIEPRGGPILDEATLRAAVDEAHTRGLRTAVHALEAGSVAAALDAGADVLAHTPVERLPDELVRELGARRVTVISTVRAFGASREARDNLAALADAGCPIVYGTDLGNGAIEPGLDPAELQIIEDALGDRDATLACATSAAGTLAGLGGRIAEGAPAALVWVPRFESYADLRRDARVFLADG